MLTETYSPAAMLSAPAASPATPATRIVPRSLVAPATPITMPAVETMPSLAPSTPARSQLSRLFEPALVRLVLVRTRLEPGLVEVLGEAGIGLGWHLGGHGSIVASDLTAGQARQGKAGLLALLR